MWLWTLLLLLFLWLLRLLALLWWLLRLRAWLNIGARRCGSHATGLLRGAFFRKLDFDFQHIKVVLPLEVDNNVFWIDFDVFTDDGNQILLKGWKVIRRVAPGALVRKNDLQPLLGDFGGFLFLAEKKIKERHAQRPPNRRSKKPCFLTSIKRKGLSAPRKRSTISI